MVDQVGTKPPSRWDNADGSQTPAPQSNPAWAGTSRRTRQYYYCGRSCTPIPKTIGIRQWTSIYTFTLRFLPALGQGLEELPVHIYERVDDASLMGPDDDGSFLLEFDRRALSLPSALASALEELLHARPRGRRGPSQGRAGPCSLFTAPRN